MKRIEAFVVFLTLITGYFGITVSEDNLSKNRAQAGTGVVYDMVEYEDIVGAEVEEKEFITSTVSAYIPEEKIPQTSLFAIDEEEEIKIPDIVMGGKNDAEDPANYRKQQTQQKPAATHTSTESTSNVAPVAKPTATPVPVLESTGSSETVSTTRKGIDVSGWQDNIDWAKVAASGVQFAMIRTGYRGCKYGKIVADHQVFNNIEGALANGIEVGVYFYSMAVDEAEAREEAAWVCSLISNYNITYPVAYDLEELERDDIRISGVSLAQFNKNAVAFLNYVASRGYTPCLYGCKSYFDHVFDMRLFSNCYIWLAQVGVGSMSYGGRVDMWQYSWKGKVPGIYGDVDMNIEYRKETVVPTVTPEEGENEADATPTPEGTITPTGTLTPTGTVTPTGGISTTPTLGATNTPTPGETDDSNTTPTPAPLLGGNNGENGDNGSNTEADATPTTEPTEDAKPEDGANSDNV